jgi:hypothetical protein
MDSSCTPFLGESKSSGGLLNRLPLLPPKGSSIPGLAGAAIFTSSQRLLLGADVTGWLCPPTGTSSPEFAKPATL